jgi:hypothetical protein
MAKDFLRFYPGKTGFDIALHFVEMQPPFAKKLSRRKLPKYEMEFIRYDGSVFLNVDYLDEADIRNMWLCFNFSDIIIKKKNPSPWSKRAADNLVSATEADFREDDIDCNIDAFRDNRKLHLSCNIEKDW